MSQELIESSLEFSQDQMAQVLAAVDANVDQRAEVQIHRLALLQPLSPEVANQTPGYEAGMFVNNVTREILSSKIKAPWLVEKGVKPDEITPCHCLLVVPCFKLPTEFIKWIPRLERKENEPPWVFKTLDQTDPRVREGVWAHRGGTWGTTEDTKGKAPPVTDNVNFLVLPIDFENKVQKASFIIQTFSRTSSQAGKMMTTYMQNHRMLGIPPWGQSYWLYTKKEHNAKANAIYFTTQIAPGPKTSVFAKGVANLAMSMALWLSDKAEGRMRQETMLNMAELIEDSHANEGNPDAGSGMEQSNPVNPGGEDPFAGDASSDAEAAAKETSGF